MSQFLDSDMTDDRGTGLMQSMVLDDPSTSATLRRKFHRLHNQNHHDKIQKPLLDRTRSDSDIMTRTLSTHVLRHKNTAPPVTVNFVKEFNDKRGESEYKDHAWMMMRKTRILGGLQPCDILREDDHIDIPSARRNFAILAQLDNHKLKTQALDNLNLLLRNDVLDKDSAFDLIPLAMEIMKQMDRELMQTQLVEVQTKISTVYSLTAELIQTYTGKAFLGAITEELKEQLTVATKKLEALNSHNDTSLHFQTSFAYEGIRRLIDDRKPLFELCERLLNVLFAVTDIFLMDGEGFSEETRKAISDVKFHLKHSWYDLAHFCNLSAREAKKNAEKLTLLQGIIDDNWEEQDWKFLYNAIDVLTDISLHGQTEEIRRNALAGSKTKKINFPGIVDFLNIDAFKDKHDLRPLLKAKKWVKRDNNVIIRKHVIEQLNTIAHESVDPILRKTAKLKLLQQSKKNEKDPELRNLLKSMIPHGEKEVKQWLNEIGSFQWQRTADPLFVERVEIGREDTMQNVAFGTLAKSAPVIGAGLLNQSDELQISQPIDGMTGSLRKAKRPPSMLIKTLGDCLGVDTDFLRNRILVDGNILPDGDDSKKLKISKLGMEDVAHLVELSSAVTVLNFEGCTIAADAFLALAEAAKHHSVIQLKLDLELNDEIASLLSDAIIENDKLEIVLSSPKAYIRLGHALETEGFICEAINYYQQGLTLNKHHEMDDAVKAKLYYRLGKAYILNNNREEALIYWKKSLKLEPNSVTTLLNLSRFLIEGGEYRIAKKYAHKALELEPSNEHATKYLAICSEPPSSKGPLRKELL